MRERLDQSDRSKRNESARSGDAVDTDLAAATRMKAGVVNEEARRMARTIRIVFTLPAALAALSACGEQLAPASPVPAGSEWAGMAGAWAPADGCGDVNIEWRLEAGAFHLFETHCAIEKLEPIEQGVRAVAQCSVEGDNDGVEDVFKFVRRDDASLSIVDESNDAATDGLQQCEGPAS